MTEHILVRKSILLQTSSYIGYYFPIILAYKSHILNNFERPKCIATLYKEQTKITRFIRQRSHKICDGH